MLGSLFDPFLKIGHTLATFQSRGNSPVLNDLQNNLVGKVYLMQSPSVFWDAYCLDLAPSLFVAFLIYNVLLSCVISTFVSMPGLLLLAIPTELSLLNTLAK